MKLYRRFPKPILGSQPACRAKKFLEKAEGSWPQKVFESSTSHPCPDGVYQPGNA
jgi:hypothetical protein